jgi:hypothetical protein
MKRPLSRCTGTPPSPPLASEVCLALEQKGVDMRIGIDVTILTLKRIVERVILNSGDTDKIPEMKLDSREGLLVEVLSPREQLSRSTLTKTSTSVARLNRSLENKKSEQSFRVQFLTSVLARPHQPIQLPPRSQASRIHLALERAVPRERYFLRQICFLQPCGELPLLRTPEPPPVTLP